jgi:hypothetical protein
MTISSAKYAPNFCFHELRSTTAHETIGSAKGATNISLG